MNINLEQRESLVTMLVGMFNASPGALYLNEFSGVLTQPGASLKSLTNSLAQTDVFKSLYSDGLTDNQFATQFVDRLIGSSTTDANKTWAVAWLAAKLNGGASRGDVVYEAVEALSNVPVENLEWGSAARHLSDKSDLAQYHSVYLKQSSNDLAVLAAAVKDGNVGQAILQAALNALKPSNAGQSIKADIIGTDGDNVLNGINGGEQFLPGKGNDIINALGADNGLSYKNLDMAVTVDMVAGTTVAADKSDSFSNISSVHGTDFDDIITGGNLQNEDWEGYYGGAGNDQLSGGEGFDELMYNNDRAGAVIVNFALGVAIDGFGDTDTFTGMEAVRGTRLDDVFYGSAAQNFTSYRGLAGNDVLQGTVYDSITGLGWDRADYSRDYQYKDALGNQGDAGISADLLSGIATDGFGHTDTLINIDHIRGTPFSDLTKGDNGDNYLDTRDGNDFLNGRGGNDKLSGGNGSDTFIFDLNWGADRITDYEVSIDRIDLTSTSLALSDLTIVTENGNTLISNATGDAITLTGVTDFSTSDFVF